MVSAAKIAQYLQGLNFPADKRKIIEYAENNNAPEDVLNLLRQMPEGRCYTMAGVWDLIEKAA